MAALQPLVAKQVREPVGQRVEVDPAIVTVEEERVVVRCSLARMAEILVVAQHAEQDEIGKNRLFLLPPCLAVVPNEPEMLATRPDVAFHHVVPAAALPI